MADGTAPLPTFNTPQGIPAITPSQQYPTPYGISQGGGTGGLVDRNKIINDGVQNALNQAQQIQKMQRDTKAYNESQAFAKGASKTDAGQVLDQPSAAPSAGHSDFMDTVLHGLSSLGSGIKNIFGGAPAAQPGIPQGPPQGAPPMQGPPTPAAAPAPQGPPQVAQVQPQMNGGAVTPQGTAPQFMKPQVSVLAFAGGGAIPDSQSSFGVMDGGTPGIRGFEAGGAIDPNSGPDAGPQMDAAVAQAHLSHVIDQLHGDMHAHALGDDDQPNHSRAVPEYKAGLADATRLNPGDIDPATISPADRAGATQLVPAGSPNAGAPPNPQAAPPAQGAAPPAQAQGPAPAAPGAAGSQGGVPTPPDPATAATAASVQAVQNAPANDPAKTGVQTTSPSAEDKPHSITPETWNKWDANINEAVRLGALAGHDPGQVRQALEANRNAYIQGHVLRYLASANVALQNGDNKGVEAAMRNAYYYMPDGQNLTVQKNSAGQLMYQDPVNPTKIDGNNVSRPNMIPVDAAHIQMLGQAMLDPMQVNRTIMEIRGSQADVAKKAAQAAAAGETGRGNLLRGEASVTRAGAQAGRVNAQNYQDLSLGDQARARATWLNNHLANTVKQNKIDPQLVKGAQDAGQAFEDAAQGQLTTVPSQVLDPKSGKMVDSQNPAAGRSTRDPTKSSIPGASPQDIVSGKALAGDIFIGSGGTKSPAEAARLATLAHTAKRSSHPGPDGKPQPDFMTDPKTGDTHVWNKAEKRWEAFRLPLTSANDAAGGKLGASNEDLDAVTQSMVAGNGGEGSRGAGVPEEDDQPNAPDMVEQNVDG